MSLYDWLVGNGGILGEYQYQTIHLVSVLVVVIVAIIFILLAYTKKISSKSKRIILISIASFQLTFEVFWRIIYLFVKKDDLVWCYPMYPCNLGGILIPLFAILNNKAGKRMFYLFAFIGGLLTFSLPEGIFNNNILVFPIVKSILQHTGLIIIPLFEYASGTFKPSIKDYPLIVLGCLIHIFNCEIITRLIGLNGDYIFFRSTLPFVIPGIPQFITLSIFASIVIFIMAYLSDIKTSKAILTNLIKKKSKERI